MQTTSPAIESRWKTYLKSAVFLAPAFIFSSMAAIFILPKLETIWRDAGLGDTPELWMVYTPKFILRNGIMLCGGILALLGLLEFTVKAWPRFRRGAVASIVFLINGTALFTLLLMLIAAIVATPAFARAQQKPALQVSR